VFVCLRVCLLPVVPLSVRQVDVFLLDPLKDLNISWVLDKIGIFKEIHNAIISQELFVTRGDLMDHVNAIMSVHGFVRPSPG
jgi:hypothetical protein